MINIEIAKLERYADLLGLLGNVHRLKIVLLLIKETKKVGEISQFLNQSQSMTSQHLAVLRSKNIVSTRRNGNEVFYSYNPDNILNFLDLENILCDLSVQFHSL